MRINDNGVDRDMTLEELAAYEAFSEQEAKRAKEEKAAQAAAEKARKAVIAKLKDLGLTDAEIAVLFPA